VNFTRSKRNGRRHTDRTPAVWQTLRLALLMLPVVLVAGCRGCRDEPVKRSVRNNLDQEMREELLTYAMKSLNRSEDFFSGKMLQQVQQRIVDSMTGDRPEDTLMEACPQPEMLRQIVLRLNQWIEGQEPLPGWKPDPLLSTLPEQLRELPLVEGLGELRFLPYDGFALQETVWLHDVSNWARGDELDDLSRAKR